MKNPQRHFVVPFDANYLHRAVLCYDSLLEYHDNFIFHAFCFDDLTYNVIKKLNHKNFIPYHTSQFETRELLRSKASKERFYEYYWSCKAFLVKKVIKEQGAESATYIDCDFMFFDSPEKIFQEMGEADVLIQPNNFSYLRVNDFVPVGYYCSCFECFKNTKNGLRVLNWWHKKCMEWCFTRFEDGKFADQKYLDDWRTRFRGVREITEVGANVAPWNAQKYDFLLKGKQIFINGKWPLIYYHFHSLRMNLSDYKYTITGDRHNSYEISPQLEELVYKPYVKRLGGVIKKLKKIEEYKKYTEVNPEGLYQLQK